MSRESVRDLARRRVYEVVREHPKLSSLPDIDGPKLAALTRRVREATLTAQDDIEAISGLAGSSHSPFRVVTLPDFIEEELEQIGDDDHGHSILVAARRHAGSIVHDALELVGGYDPETDEAIYLAERLIDDDDTELQGFVTHEETHRAQRRYAGGREGVDGGVELVRQMTGGKGLRAARLAPWTLLSAIRSPDAVDVPWLLSADPVLRARIEQAYARTATAEGHAVFTQRGGAVRRGTMTEAEARSFTARLAVSAPRGAFRRLGPSALADRQYADGIGFIDGLRTAASVAGVSGDEAFRVALRSRPPRSPSDLRNAERFLETVRREGFMR